MQSNLATKYLPIVSDEKKIEVTLEDDKAIIKLSTWTENLGWCGQKTLSVDAEMLDDLHRIIASARYKLNNKKAESAENFQSKKILEFPKFA